MKKNETLGRVAPMLLLEMNEVPWKVVDHYRRGGLCPNLDRFIAGSRTYTTTAVDAGELSPWVTWPSLHRGMGNEEHGILNLGQDPETFRGVPIWEEYRRRGLSIGVCGSMQSWPPADPGKGGFYIPDTFAHDERCIPARVEPFQRFNLDQVRSNGRQVKKELPKSARVLGLLKSLPGLGISPSTLIRVARQIAGELRDRTLVARRPIFQTILIWDIFKKLYDAANPPAFATFFSNHVAGVMHRYWNHVFPEDFGDANPGAPLPHRKTMDFAMRLMDRILGEALGFQERNPNLILVLATSMGQAAIRRDNHQGFEASIPRLDKLMAACGFAAGEYKPLLAMVPQVAVEIRDEGRRKSLRRKLEACRTASGKTLFLVQEIGASLSITIKTPTRADKDAGGFDLTADGARIGWAEAGVEMLEMDPGTAYHIPEGVLAIRRGGESGAGDRRAAIKASEVKTLLMKEAGLASEGAAQSVAGIADVTPAGVR